MPNNTQKPRVSPDNEELSIHHLFLDTAMKLVKHLGCPHGCGEGHREEDALQLKRGVITTLSFLLHSSEAQFGKFFEEMVTRRTIQEIIDLFHAFLGFCSDTQQSPNNLISPLGQLQTKKSHNPIIGQQSFDSSSSGGIVRTGYATNFGAGFGKLGPKG